MSTSSGELRTRNLRTVLALAALFFLPVAVSFVMYYGTDWRPADTTAHGELMQPPRALPPIELDEVSTSEPRRTPVFTDKWALVYIGAGSCDDACRNALYVMRQTRLGLHKEMTRVARVFLATDPCCAREFLAQEHEGMLVFDAGTSDAERLLREFPQEERSHSLFIVDPLGNLVMRHDTRDNPSGLLRDLKKLLKLSHIG